jgi:hypothetical protein
MKNQSETEKKYYYFKTSSSMPIYATLVTKKGNADLKISILADMAKPKASWKEEYSKPIFKSENSFGADLIYLNPTD